MTFLIKINTIYRITDWLPFLGFALIGFLLKVSYIDITSLRHLFFILIFSSLLLSYAYSLNDYFDKGGKRKYFLLPLVFSVILLPFFNSGQILWIVIFFVLFTLYSLEWVALSKSPVVGTLINTIGFLSIFMIGHMTKEGIAMVGVIFLFLLSIYQTISQLIHEKVHLKEDIESGRKTSVFYLKEKTELFIKGMLILTLPLALFLLLRTNFIFFGIACILFSLFFLIKASQIDKQLRKTYKLDGMIVGLFFLLDYFLRIYNFSP